MTNILIASFEQEAQAIEASHKLSELESIGDITIYERVIIKKYPDETFEVLQAETAEGLRTFSGMALGTMIGALAGPVGMAVGMLSGTLTGAALEEDYFNFSESFGSKVINKMQSNTVAVIAEVDEDNTVFIDSTLSKMGATIIRTDVDYEYGEYTDEQIDALNEEIAAERANLKAAAEADKTKIRNKISQLKEKRKKRIAEFEKK